MAEVKTTYKDPGFPSKNYIRYLSPIIIDEDEFEFERQESQDKLNSKSPEHQNRKKIVKSSEMIYE